MRWKALGERGETAYVGHQNADSPPFEGELKSIISIEKVVDDVVGDEPPKGLAKEGISNRQLLRKVVDLQYVAGSHVAPPHRTCVARRRTAPARNARA